MSSEALPAGVSIHLPDRSHGRRLDVESIARSRLLVIAAALFYGYSLQYAHVNYLHPEWGYFGFSYRPPDTVELLIMYGLLAAGSALLPTALARPSSIVVLLLFVVVYVPTVVVTLGLDADRVTKYGPSLGLLCIAFMAVCVGARRRQDSRGSHGSRLPGDVFCAIIVALWGICCTVLIAKYGSVMRFVGIDEIYDQRVVGASTSLAIGYLQTYFGNVINPTLMALGLLRRRWWLTALGVTGCLIMFMISAQKTIIMLPVALYAIHFAMQRPAVFRTTAFGLVALAVTVIWMSSAYVDNLVVTLAASMLVFRTLALPGLTFSQYYDLFSEGGFTWWSHVKGLNLLIPTPESYVEDELWPNLGYMIGERLYGSVDYNGNANLFSGDGVAAAGALGVGVIGLVLAIWLFWLDKASRGWDRRFAILVTLPIALALTNGHFFTTLLSFGGLFWMLTFFLYKPRG